MERITSKINEDFPPTTLYLDELAEIIAVLVQYCERIEIRAGEYKITNPAELEDLASKFPLGRFGNISIAGHTPYISVELRKSGISTYMSEDNLENRGIISKIKDILNTGKRKSPIWKNPIFLYDTTSNGLMVLGVVSFFQQEYAVGAIFVALSLFLIPLKVRHEMSNKLIVHSKKKGATTSFFERRKDEIILASTSAILSGALTYFIAKFLP